ncbi:TlpA family protein disulfide reductase [Rhodopseudomonas sp. HC1]|uniref:thiol:disulfide interchange protein TlpA n=1 Tax=Rhodopseudomonas infernalis TaxID=2897386 RepID=UPI001EE999C8|nr:TlpA family protein disulfide reductase [Rhodopseudomonas infernalis]MCG6207641.1 TlpA family protein disulfide reductase [Rhodopseudomonas infernalis]
MTDTRPDSVPPRRKGRKTLILAAMAVLVVAGAAGVYGIGALQRNAGDPTCRPAVALAQQLKPLTRGEVAAVTVAAKPLKLPDLAFEDGSGQPKKLSDFRGRTVLVNLWATWCVPCRKEMPALDNLQAKLGSPQFEVVAINIDTRDPAKPKKFLEDEKLTTLNFFSDASARVFQDLKGVGRALGMPTSVLVDGQGCELATIAGPAEWDSADAQALVKAALPK